RLEDVLQDRREGGPGRGHERRSAAGQVTIERLLGAGGETAGPDALGQMGTRRGGGLQRLLGKRAARHPECAQSLADRLDALLPALALLSAERAQRVGAG